MALRNDGFTIQDLIEMLQRVPPDTRLVGFNMERSFYVFESSKLTLNMEFMIPDSLYREWDTRNMRDVASSDLALGNDIAIGYEAKKPKAIKHEK